jgi:hypothetical protein
MRRRDDRRDALFTHGSQSRPRFVEVGGAIVHAWHKVTVKVDHRGGNLIHGCRVPGYCNHLDFAA